MSPLRPTPATLLAALGLTTAILLGGCSLLPSNPNPGAGSSTENTGFDTPVLSMTVVRKD